MPLIPLTHYQVVQIHGVDAAKFLQGQLTCDVDALSDNAATLAAHCDPKGKMTSIFYLLKCHAECFLMLIKQDLLPAGLDALKKYAVFSKVTFTPLDWQRIGVIDPENSGQKCGQIAGSFCLPLPDGRQIWLNEIAQPVTFNGDITDWEIADIQQGIPTLSPPTQQQFIPQALNLQHIGQTLSFTKGCYIGQETVARAKYRGANKHALFAFKADTDAVPPIGSALEMAVGEHWRQTGTVINAAQKNGTLWLLAVLNKDLDENTTFRLPLNAVPLHSLPLPYTQKN